MTLSDVTILGKKILVGIIVTVVPFVIIAGGLWLGQKALSNHDDKHPQEISKPANTTTP